MPKFNETVMNVAEWVIAIVLAIGLGTVIWKEIIVGQNESITHAFEALIVMVLSQVTAYIVNRLKKAQDNFK